MKGREHIAVARQVSTNRRMQGWGQATIGRIGKKAGEGRVGFVDGPLR